MFAVAVAVLRPVPGRGASAEELRCHSLWRGHRDEKATASPSISCFSWRMTLQTDVWEVTVLGRRCETSACIPPLPTPQSPGLPCATVQVHPRRTTSVSSCLSPIPCHMDTVSCPSLLCNVPLRRPVRELVSVLALPSGRRLIR